MALPFEVSFRQLVSDLDSYVDEVFASLQSEFLTLPKGEGFVDYPVFERGYETLKRTTGGFRTLEPDKVIEAVYQVPADTLQGLSSVQALADLGVPYAMLLYERFLGRPFAGHRDSVSELVGDVLETAIEGVLSQAGISFRKTRRAERIVGFDQAPDFIVPNEFNPQVVIEAKVTEDDGTARDKVTRVQHLGNLAMRGLATTDAPRFEVIACIAGRGFKVRREDMRKLLLATRGKVFTLQNLNQLVDHSRLAEFRTR